MRLETAQESMVLTCAPGLLRVSEAQDEMRQWEAFVQLLPQEQPGVRLWRRRPADNARMRAQQKEGVGTRGTIARSTADGMLCRELGATLLLKK